MNLPTYRQWQMFRERLPLPHQLKCIHCYEPLDWQAYDVARRGKRGDITHEQATVVRVGALCKVKRYEWYIPPDGSSEDIVESWKDAIIPFHVSGVGCPTCQVLQSSADSDAMREYQSNADLSSRRRILIAVPHQFDPKTNLRLPTSVSTRNTYIKQYARRSPSLRIAYIDVAYRVLSLHVQKEAR